MAAISSSKDRTPCMVLNRPENECVPVSSMDDDVLTIVGTAVPCLVRLV
jgi:hypothetical protein